MCAVFHLGLDFAALDCHIAAMSTDHGMSAT
jgi:hypothetical protein